MIGAAFDTIGARLIGGAVGVLVGNGVGACVKGENVGCCVVETVGARLVLGAVGGFVGKGVGACVEGRDVGFCVLVTGVTGDWVDARAGTAMGEFVTRVELGLLP